MPAPLTCSALHRESPRMRGAGARERGCSATATGLRACARARADEWWSALRAGAFRPAPGPRGQKQSRPEWEVLPSLGLSLWLADALPPPTACACAWCVVQRSPLLISANTRASPRSSRTSKPACMTSSTPTCSPPPRAVAQCTGHFVDTWTSCLPSITRASLLMFHARSRR